MVIIIRKTLQEDTTATNNNYLIHFGNFNYNYTYSRLFLIFFLCFFLINRKIIINL